MTQKQMLERILRPLDGVSEKLARSALNEAQDEFADETEILEEEVQNITSSNALAYGLDDRVIEVKGVWKDGEEVPPFQAHRDGVIMWKVDGGDTLVMGKWDEDNEEFDEATGVDNFSFRHSVRPPQWTSSNMTTECEFPQRFHSALVHKAIHDLLLHQPQFGESDLARKRELFTLWKNDVNQAQQITNKGRDGSRYTIVHRGF